ncbi:MAG: OmpH family outer membrane protein [Gemmatimonadetes bacterium]|nr:OmpH family outer membrane protein [Gemmatimonadota bacterium]
MTIEGSFWMVWGSMNIGMTRTFGLLALALSVSATPALAQTASVTVGVFDADRILAESLAGQQALALFSQLRDQRAGEVQAQQVEFNTLRQQVLQAVPGSPEAVSMQRQVEDKSLQLQRLNEDVQNELGARQAALTEEITQKIATIIDELGAERGFALIFNNVQSGLAYWDPAVDLTDEIIARLDASTGGGDR